MTDVVATVVATRSSAPRPVGSKLIVRADGSLEGSVSNGCVESDVILAAQEVMETGVPRLVTYGITDEMAFGVGLPCGGEIDVFVEPLGERRRRRVRSPSSPATAWARSCTIPSSSRRRAVAAAAT